MSFKMLRKKITSQNAIWGLAQFGSEMFRTFGWTNLLDATSEFSRNDCYMNQVSSESARTAALAQVSRERSCAPMQMLLYFFSL